MVQHLDRVKIKKGSLIRGYAIDGKGDFEYNAGKTYTVIVEQHYVDEIQGRDEIHWRSRKGNYSFTEFKNVVI